MAKLPELLQIYQTAHLEISHQHAARLVDKARKFIETVISDLETPPVFGWSGGKDSVVLEFILRPFWLEGVCCLTKLEFPVVERFIAEHLPERVRLVHSAQDLEWLKANPRYLFARDPATNAAWYRKQQQTALDAFAAEKKAEMVITGRRRVDGNFVPSALYKPKAAPARFAPILDMAHAEVWAIMRHFGLPEYPLYALAPTSVVNGTASWPQEPSWAVVKAIDHRLYERVYPHFAA